MVKPTMISALFCISLSLQAVYASPSNQTVESAQKFLAITLPEKDFLPGSLQAQFKQIARSNSDSSRVYEYGKILDASPINRCVSKWSYSTDGLKVRIDHKNRFLVKPLNVLKPDLKTVTNDNGIDWGEVLSVRQDKQIVEILFSSKEETSKINLASDDLATRVAFAIKYLQHHCDKASETGF